MCSADQNASMCLFLSCIQIEWQQRQFVVDTLTSPKHYMHTCVVGRLAKVLSDEIYERICWALRTPRRLWFSFQPTPMTRLWRPGTRVFCCFEGPEQFAIVGVSHGPILLGLFLELVHSSVLALACMYLQLLIRMFWHSPDFYKLTLQDMWSRTLTINGFSKIFSMTGYLDLWSDCHGVLPSRRSILDS